MGHNAYKVILWEIMHFKQAKNRSLMLTSFETTKTKKCDFVKG